MARADPQPEHVQWVAQEIARLRALDYEELLRRRDRPVHREIRSVSGEPFICETQVFWDSKHDRTLRVIVDVWHPTPRLIVGSLAKDDFIRAPDGSFIGE